MANLARLALAAFRALQSAGLTRAVTLAVTNGGTYNPATGTKPGGSTTTHTPTAAPWDFHAREVNGTSVQANDRRYLIPAGEASGGGMLAEPTTAYTLTDGSVTHRVLHVETVSIGESPALYIVHCRK